MEPDEDRAVGAFILSLLAGVLIFGEGVLFLFAAYTAGHIGYAGEAFVLLGGLGFFAAFFGLIILVLAILMFVNPEYTVGYGVAVLVFSLVSFLVGGGFLIGSVLGVVGGVLAFLYEPFYDPLRETPRTGVAFSPPTPRTCPSCGSPIPSGARACPACGRPPPPG